MNDPYVHLAVKLRRAYMPLNGSRKCLEAESALHYLVWTIWRLEDELAEARGGGRRVEEAP